MNEADIPNFRDFVESVDSACPFYAVLPHESPKTTQLLLLKPAKEDSQTEVTSEKKTTLDWVAEPDSEKQAIIDAEFKNLLALNEELRCANNQLYERVEELTALLTESTKALQLQTKRLDVTESMLSQQNQEVTAAENRIQSLSQQLEIAVQTTGRQETQLESYKGQLEISQQRIAQLERECAALQSNYNEQSHQLLESENSCRDLRTRLMRQQRQTLQFKAALEKCLETPNTSYDYVNNSVVETSRCSKRHSFIPNAKPIKPWSVELELTPEINTGIILDQDVEENREQEESVEIQSDRSINQPLPQETAQQSTPKIPTPEVAPQSLNLEEQLDSVIQMFFVSTPASEQPLPQQISQTESTWETIDTPLVDSEAETATITLEQKDPPVVEDFWSQMSQPHGFELQETASTDVNSPSPVIYPQRSPKRRTSFAAVELPNFRPRQS